MFELSVPWLRSGAGSTPADGGCILQVIDWVSRNQWTDAPPCVHPALRRLAIRANDTLPDDQRQKLLDLAPRLMGTNSDDKVLSVKLAVFFARQVLPIWETKYPQDDRPRKSIEAAEMWVANPTEENRQKATKVRRSTDAYASAAAAAYAADAASAAYAAAYAADAAHGAADAASRGEAIYGLLVATLDEYDRVVGRSKTGAVDLSPAVIAMAGAKV